MLEGSDTQEAKIKQMTRYFKWIKFFRDLSLLVCI